jgi:hypothetical protein
MAGLPLPLTALTAQTAASVVILRFQFSQQEVEALEVVGPIRQAELVEELYCHGFLVALLNLSTLV